MELLICGNIFRLCAVHDGLLRPTDDGVRTSSTVLRKSAAFWGRNTTFETQNVNPNVKKNFACLDFSTIGK